MISRRLCLFAFMGLIAVLGCAKFELKAESGFAMPWNGFLEQAGSGKTDLLDRSNFRAYFIPTAGYEFFQDHLIEVSIVHFSVNSSLEATGTESLITYESMFRQDVLSVTYGYALPVLDRFSLQLGVQGRLLFKQIDLTGSEQYSGKMTDFGFGPAADIKLKMNDQVFVALEVATGLGKGNGFIDFYTGLHFEGPFYYVRAGSRYWSLTNSFDGDRLFLSFVSLGAQFCAYF